MATTASQRRNSRNRPTNHFDEWVGRARQAAFRRAKGAGRREFDAHDVAQEVAEFALAFGASLTAAYPDPEVFAAARTFHAGVGWDRRNGVQCGAGAAFGRVKVSLDAPRGEGGSVYDTLESCGDTEHDVERRLVGESLRLLVATTLDPRAARWLWDVRGHGLTVSEVARRDGVSRELVSRTVNGALRTLQPVAGEFVGG
jgi:DNA-directed RNA polymerase specialized sigma24 family protein